ncbi:MAG: hypothetical protein V3T05_11805 [Myxococcota bacterium]
MNRVVQTAIGALTACGLIACAGPSQRVPISGTLAGVLIETTVDADVARYYLEDYLSGRNTNAALDARIDALHTEYADRFPDRYELKAIADELSLDFGSLFLAQLVTTRDANRRMQARFHREVRRLREKGRLEIDSAPHEVIFIPAWLYRDNIESGANLMIPRTALAAAGVKVHLARLVQDGTTEENAAIIAETIRRLRNTGKRYMIMSVSKSAGETAMALSELLTLEESQHVRAWVNTNGVLRGTPLADAVLKMPLGLVVRPFFWLNGWDTKSIYTALPEVRRPAFERMKLPKHITVVNVVGMSVSGQLSDQGKAGYPLLAPYGPNDGVTLVADSMVPGAPTVVCVGMDHYLESPELPWWSVAIYNVVTQDAVAAAESQMLTPEAPAAAFSSGGNYANITSSTR